MLQQSLVSLVKRLRDFAFLSGVETSTAFECIAQRESKTKAKAGVNKAKERC